MVKENRSRMEEFRRLGALRVIYAFRREEAMFLFEIKTGQAGLTRSTERISC